MLEVYPVRSPVLFGEHKATILRIQIGLGDVVVYEIGFFGPGGTEWKELWVNDFLLKPLTAAKQSIGFKSASEKQILP